MVVQARVTVKNPLGLHARPAALFVQLAKKFHAEVVVRKGRLSANGKSIMSVLMLGAQQGSQIRIQANGKDADAGVRTLAEFIAQEAIL